MALIGLEGTDGREIPHQFIERSSSIKKATMDSGIAYTAAGSNGAINIYQDDDGQIRCQAMRYCRTIDKQKYSKVKDVKVWADKWLKEIAEYE